MKGGPQCHHVSASWVQREGRPPGRHLEGAVDTLMVTHQENAQLRLHLRGALDVFGHQVVQMIKQSLHNHLRCGARDVKHLRNHTVMVRPSDVEMVLDLLQSGLRPPWWERVAPLQGNICSDRSLNTSKNASLAPLQRTWSRPMYSSSFICAVEPRLSWALVSTRAMVGMSGR